MNTGQAVSGLADVIINSELLCRPARLPDYEVENKSLTSLARVLADSPDQIWQSLAETALQLCRADSAGISLLEQKDGQEVIRWEATAGVFSDRRNTTMLRDTSSCAATIDQNAPLLMRRVDRAFPALKSQPPIVEIMIIPFQIENNPVGTLWIVAHDESRKFDQNDARILKTLTEFASASWQLCKARAEAEAAVRNGSEKTAQSDKIRTIVTDVAHDINNDLNTIHGYATLIMSDTTRSSDVIEAAQGIRKNIEVAAARSRSLFGVFEGRLNSEMKVEITNVNDQNASIQSEIVRQTLKAPLSKSFTNVKLDPLTAAQVKPAGQQPRIVPTAKK
jgi:signal transduction histidine kinase